jgi:DNA repair exonuclease SbcCD ATPase subunit
MKLHRLRVQSFAAIPELDVTFGPGLNVLYGPNDLGKSTLADAIRLALLLPHTSTSYEPYIPWSGADDPIVELTFEMEAQRIWRVRKQFGKRGSSLLQESRNGQDYDDVERARRVDARLREILRWGIPEPGGSGAGKGLPTSFLATALLSTQSDVADVLGHSLHDDGTASGKDQIAAALQAVAQDPLFLALLRQAQERRDEAYTDKGAKKTARGSVFKVAADRVKETREEKERLEKVVEESEGVERHLEDLYRQRERCDEELASAEERLAAVQLLAQQVVDRAAAWEAVEAARAQVSRIQGMDQAVAEAEQRVRDFAAAREQAKQTLKDAQAVRARETWTEATTAETAANEALGRCDLLERGVEARNAERQLASARAGVERESALQAELARASAQRSDVAGQRASIVVPPTASLPALRKLETELASARGALDVGLVMTVIPTAFVNLRVRKDGVAVESGLIAQPLEIEADAEVEVDVADLATVRVRGGRREAQDRVRTLASRRDAEILPHLSAAGVADLEALEAKMAEAKELDVRLQSLDVNLESLQRQVADLAGAAEALRDASARAEACRLALGDVTLETLAADLDRLGPDPAASLRARRQQASRDAETARAAVKEAVEEARRAVETSQEAIAKAIADHANEEGRLVERRRQRETEDLSAAERGHDEAIARHDALPVPERSVTAEEVIAATDALGKARQNLASLTEEILTTQGRLRQVGGAIARDRLRDATEAWELAEHQDHELEMDYEAWKLLLEQMKAADADQASNLGQALAPAIAGRFQTLTRQRYQNVHLTAHLGTEGVFVAGAVRSPDRISVGTREQLSTLYRLCLGEYLQTTIVLDDQLVQSDDTRMEWFRALLAEKARSFQIVVFTCRPGDYLAPEAMVVEDGAVYADSDEGFVRAIDLGRVVGRK